jgi:RNA polymerase sigma-70 factor (ECF subfamily)
MQPESALIAAARQGDREAISDLYEAHVQPVYRYIAYRVESDAVAEDLTSEVFLRMVKTLPTYRDTGAPFRAWLYRVAANLITDHYRQGRHTSPEAFPEDLPLDETDPFGRAAKAAERDTLRAALASLPQDFQSLLILRFMEGLPTADVAAALEKSEGAVRVMQHRALKALAEALGAQGKARSYLRGVNHG